MSIVLLCWLLVVKIYLHRLLSMWYSSVTSLFIHFQFAEVFSEISRSGECCLLDISKSWIQNFESLLCAENLPLPLWGSPEEGQQNRSHAFLQVFSIKPTVLEKTMRLTWVFVQLEWHNIDICIISWHWFRNDKSESVDTTDNTSSEFGATTSYQVKCISGQKGCSN